MTSHEAAIQRRLLHTEPLMQVNHVLNILISRRGLGGGGGGGGGGLAGWRWQERVEVGRERNLFRTLAGMLGRARTEGWHNEFWRAGGC